MWAAPEWLARSAAPDRGVGRLGLRTDMNRLAITEQSGLPHASRVPGVTHACGYDGHTAVLLGAARHLAGNPDFGGTVHLIFQLANRSFAESCTTTAGCRQGWSPPPAARRADVRRSSTRVTGIRSQDVWGIEPWASGTAEHLHAFGQRTGALSSSWVMLSFVLLALHARRLGIPLERVVDNPGRIEAAVQVARERSDSALSQQGRAGMTQKSAITLITVASVAARFSASFGRPRNLIHSTARHPF